ncbi:MAG: MFS transporter [Pseudomonadota bacterium]
MTPKTITPHQFAQRTLVLMWAVFAIAQLDRHILSLSLDAISTEFGLTDTQLGLLSGLAFALVFVVVGFPVAALCARYDRHKIIGASVAVWSGFTVIMGVAHSIGVLLLARICVGAGEAGAVAPAHSILSDAFPNEKHATVLSTFATGANIGVLLAAFIGGGIGQIYGWHAAFVGAGVPGLILAVLLVVRGRDPQIRPRVDLGLVMIFTLTWQTIFQERIARLALLAFCMQGTFTFGTSAWAPTYLIRQFDLNVAQIAGFVVVSTGLIGAISTYASGRLVDY